MSKVTIEELVANYTAAHKAMVDTCSANFAGFFQEVFDKFSTVESFSFVGYVPYFCDGDPCQYSVNDYRFDITLMNGKTGTCGDYYEDEEIEELEMNVKELDELYKEIQKSLNKIPDDIIESIYGSDNRVTVHRDGKVESEHYGDHD